VTRRTFSVACPFLAAAGRTPGSSPFIAANSTASVTLAFRAAAGRTPGSSPFIAAKTILFILFMSFTSIHQHTATAAHQPAAPTLCVGARQPRHQTAALVLYAAAYSRVQPRAGWISTTVSRQRYSTLTIRAALVAFEFVATASRTRSSDRVP